MYFATIRKSFDELQRQIDQIELAVDMEKSDLVVYMVGNKVDLEVKGRIQVSLKIMEKLAIME